MKKTFFIIIFIIFISGCSNFNPRLQNRIANENGKIEDIKNNQNGLMLELGKLRNEAQIQNSQLKEVQQGMLNMNNALSRNENSGIQILQGDGSLMLIFALASIGMLLFHYRNKANNNEKIANMLAVEVARFNDPNLNDNILRTSMFTSVESKMFKLLNTHVKKIPPKY